VYAPKKKKCAKGWLRNQDSTDQKFQQTFDVVMLTWKIEEGNFQMASKN
jgi:hypothetical protein